MLSLLSKIWSKYKKTIITSLKLHQILTNQSITYQNYIWTKHIIFQKRKLSQEYQQQLQQKLQIASAEAILQKQLQQKLQIASAEVEIVFAETVTAPTHFAVVPVVVPEIDGSLKTYLTIFIQIMNLMPSIVLQTKDVIIQL